MIGAVLGGLREHVVRHQHVAAARHVAHDDGRIAGDVPRQESRHHAAGEIDRAADAAARDDGDGLALVEVGDRIGLGERACGRGAKRQREQQRVSAGLHSMLSSDDLTRAGLGAEHRFKARGQQLRGLRQFARHCCNVTDVACSESLVPRVNLAPLAGRGRRAKRSGEGGSRRLGVAPHPNPLPVRTGRGSRPPSRHLFRESYAIFRSFLALPENTLASSAGASLRSRIIWMPSPLIGVSGGASVPNTNLSAPTVSTTQRAAGRW